LHPRKWKFERVKRKWALTFIERWSPINILYVQLVLSNLHWLNSYLKFDLMYASCLYRLDSCMVISSSLKSFIYKNLIMWCWSSSIKITFFNSSVIYIVVLLIISLHRNMKFSHNTLISHNYWWNSLTSFKGSKPSKDKEKICNLNGNINQSVYQNSYQYISIVISSIHDKNCVQSFA
jgi:L-lactate permease